MSLTQMFLKTPDSFKSTASAQLGYDKLSEDNKKIADMISVVEQKVDWTMGRMVLAYNLVIILTAAMIVTNGPALIQVLLAIFGIKT